MSARIDPDQCRVAAFPDTCNAVWPKNFKIDVAKANRDKIVSKVKEILGSDAACHCEERSDEAISTQWRAQYWVGIASSLRSSQ